MHSGSLQLTNDVSYDMTLSFLASMLVPVAKVAKVVWPVSVCWAANSGVRSSGDPDPSPPTRDPWQSPPLHAGSAGQESLHYPLWHFKITRSLTGSQDLDPTFFYEIICKFGAIFLPRKVKSYIFPWKLKKNFKRLAKILYVHIQFLLVLVRIREKSFQIHNIAFSLCLLAS
jgi:hypothetical protein